MSFIALSRRAALTLNTARRSCPQCRERFYTTKTTITTESASKRLNILGKDYLTDEYTNITPAILSKLNAGLYSRPGHPLCTLREIIETHLGSDFTALTATSSASTTSTTTTTNLNLNPIVTPLANFDQLSFPADHPGRSRTDTYYINQNALLRTHTSAHEVEIFGAGLRRWLLAADVFRRDEVDARHYPVFHQMEGARLWESGEGKAATVKKEIREEDEAMRARLSASGVALIDESALFVPGANELNPIQPTHDPELAALVASHLRSTLSHLLVALFGSNSKNGSSSSVHTPLQIRWIPAYFPFTTPSYEVEVFFNGRWLEVLGCGVVQQATLTHAGVGESSIGWAFGLGLERIAMVLFGIPDIRLFWSNDRRFLSQFGRGEVRVFRPYSRYPASMRDVSFWLPPAGGGGGSFHANDFADIVRGVAGDLAETVELVRSLSLSLFFSFSFMIN